MEEFNRKKHWENIYQTKSLNEVSWYQPKPETSLDFVEKFNLPKTAKIIDVGGGDSFFVDYLLELGFLNLTVLDISEAAIDRVKNRLGEKATMVKWIVEDISKFQPADKYDFWHDRAAFHFLTNQEDIEKYVKIVSKNIENNGFLVVGTFSLNGPEKCSGIKIRQYSELTLTNVFEPNFVKIGCFTIDHRTPFDTTQNFVFCSFRKK
ncbi:hypothetical protein CHRY9390_02296 [Chryseobacterium aquaeductus]|uniref:Methyltransferase type 12 domain-containing protein n=1 Tax=Chryseobacterium aquaeductus TaxID=2675056 RepID=A0A9N8MPL2_9FLAO|nr:class I SAM-dependent methyltransferase [Chryseobacterium aquaeductus]CAA7331583.1 hypothetical protein CHRY9390_02296 [Chryseobacterium potabilaquae]CAD7811074.1 hypothetical protein CHRY9390_02296 [Chryseobacterium aquaeductus]